MTLFRVNCAVGRGELVEKMAKTLGYSLSSSKGIGNSTNLFEIMYLSSLSSNISVCTRVLSTWPTLNGSRMAVNWAGTTVARQSVTCPENFVCRSFSEGRIKDSDMEVTQGLYPRNFALESSIRVEENTWGLGDTTMLEDRVANSENAKQVISRKDCGPLDPSDSSAASTREELHHKLPEADILCKDNKKLKYHHKYPI